MKGKKSLKRTFISTMLVAVAIIGGLSAATIWGCNSAQKVIMPDPNAAYLHVVTTDAQGKEEKTVIRLEFGKETEAPTLEEQIEGILIKIGQEVTTYSLDKIESSFESLSPQRKAAYSGLSVCKVLLPAIYSIAGTLLSAMWFYRRKLYPPIAVLTEATENIAAKNLDFTVEYDSEDEMGRLCDSFEIMRKTMYENNQALWHMLEERRMLQASLAHDLRNPIAIIEGYTEYLQQKAETDSLTADKLRHTLPNLSAAAKRLSRYTESIQDIQRLEDIEVMLKPCPLPQLLLEMTEDFAHTAKAADLAVDVHTSMEPCTVMIDGQILYRILENIFSNAIRFAEEKICFDAALWEDMLRITITDDGTGFPDEVLKTKNRYNLSAGHDGNHMGIGLVISRILCEKHGGGLKVANTPGGGAQVQIEVKIKNENS